MNEEYPSTLEEAFEVPMEGAILEAVLDKAVQEGAFGSWPMTQQSHAIAHGTWERR